MLIGIDSSRATGPQRTGTENYSLFLIRALLELDTENRYRLYFNGPPAPDLFTPRRNVQLRAMPFARLWTHIRLSLEMATNAPDVLFVPAHVLPLVHPPRCVATIHDLGYLYYPQMHTRWARWYLQWSTAFNVRAATQIIADSEATKRDLIAHCHADPDGVTVVYPGYDESFTPVQDQARLTAVRQRYGLTRTYVLYVGTLQPRKNLTTLLDAFAALLEQGRDVDLVIAGKRGWLYESLFGRARSLGLQERVHWLGYVPPEDLPALLTGARAFAQPSLYEGFGLPILEAMACGTPVICSGVSSLPEVAGDAAILVDPHAVGELTQALRRVLDDDELHQELTRRGLQQVSRFSWARCAAETLTVLEMVSRMHPGAPSPASGIQHKDEV